MAILACIMSIYKENSFQITRAVNSILNQTFKDFEFVIVIDNPDNLEAIELIVKYAESDKRIKYFINEKNMGLVYSRNFAIDNSDFEFLTFIDADDECLSNRFEVQIQFMKDNIDIDLSGCGMNLILEMNHNYSLKLIPPSDFEKRIKRVCPINGNGIMVRKSGIQKFGKFSPKYKRTEDYEFLISWFVKGAKIKILNEVLYNYFIQDNYQQKSLVTLKLAISLKWKNRNTLKFRLGDYLYFLYDFAVLGLLYIIPSKLYFRLFIFRNQK